MINPHPLSLATRPLFEHYLTLSFRDADRGGIPLSAYSFIPHFLWRDHFAFSWAIHKESFLLFAEYDRCIYMPLPPLGAGTGTREIVIDCFDYMDQINPNRRISRIDNIDEAARPLYEAMGLQMTLQEEEYIYCRKSLAELRGDRYRHPRAACHRFQRECRPKARAYTLSDHALAVRLLGKWMARRLCDYPNPLYRQMLHDSKAIHLRALAESEQMGLTGWVVEVRGEIVGYSFGFPLSQGTFSILLEVADLDYVGAAAYLFRSFCVEVPYHFLWINVMGDSGLQNLKRVKEGYRPIRKIGCYSLGMHK